MASKVELNIHIESQDEAMVDCPAIRAAEVLEELARRLRTGHGGGIIRDVNGNRIGRMDFGVE